MQEHCFDIKRALEEALDQPAEARPELIERLCPDPQVRAEVWRLLDQAETDTGFLDRPPALIAQTVLEDLAETSAFTPGAFVANRFRIERLLGRGGMGEVYEAYDSQSLTSVALKTIRSGITADPDILARLRAELVLARSVTHRNVCRIFELHQATEALFLTMELLHGETLAARLGRKGPLDTREALDVVRQLTAGLSAAHEAGVVHRDLKPSNIMLVPTGTNPRVVIMDFGIAAAAGARPDDPALNPAPQVRAPSSGTPGYIAPELAKGSPITAAADVYSLGVVMREMAPGRPKSRWNSVVHRCLEPEPKDRFQSAAAVLEALVHRKTRYAMAMIGIAAALLLAVAIGHRFEGRRSVDRANLPVFAVLGFRNLSAAPQADYLSLLLALALDADLAARGNVRVVPAGDVARMMSELRIHDWESLSPDVCRRVRSNLGADVLIVGSYSAANTGRIHVAISAADAHSGKRIASIGANGDQSDLPGLPSRAGAELRANLRLGFGAGDVNDISDELPGRPEAMHLYAEGLQRLRSFDALGAREYLERAVAVEPSFALAHSALASAWGTLGYDRRAEAEGKKAVELSSKLRPEDRLQIEGDYFDLAHQRSRAADAYSGLLRKFPDNPDYLLHLAKVQAGDAALATIRRARKLPAPVRDDPRIDLAEAEAADKANDFRLEQASARRAAEKARARGAVILEAEARIDEGWSSWILGELARSEAAYTQARDLYGAVGDRNGFGTALRGLALVAKRKGELARAEQLLDTAIGIFNGIGSKKNAAQALNTRALIAGNRGRLNEAAELYGNSLSICREIQDPRCSGRALNNSAYVLYRLGRLKEAHAKLDEAFAQYDLARQPYGKSFVLSGLGDVLLAEGRMAEAQTALEAAIALSKKVGDRSSEASTQISLAELRRGQGRLAEAEKICQSAISTEASLGESDAAAYSRIVLARILLDLGKTASAEADLRQTLPFLLRSGRVPFSDTRNDPSKSRTSRFDNWAKAKTNWYERKS